MSFQNIRDLIDSIFSVIKTIGIIDILDMALLSYIIYLALKLMRETRAGQLIKGIVLLAGGYIICKSLQLRVTTYIISKALDIGLIAVLIIFQPELRRALEKVGRARMSQFFGFGETQSDLETKWARAIQAICDSCVELSATFTGALIVIERRTRLGEQIETGTIINATPSKEIFGNIFYPKTPLHDGAVIMRDGNILAAACFLPKPQKEELVNKKLGSRHRAAIGMSENSDAIVIVVSEETGQISIAVDGVLTRDYTHEKLKKFLVEEILAKQFDNSKNNKKSTSSKRKRRNKNL
jgi:diadenylate cyclase